MCGCSRFACGLQQAKEEAEATASPSASSALAAPDSGASATAAAATAPAPQYEFNSAEERVLRGLTEASNTAGLAITLQAFVTLLLGERGCNLDTHLGDYLCYSQVLPQINWSAIQWVSKVLVDTHNLVAPQESTAPCNPPPPAPAAAANFGVGDLPEMVSNGINSVNKGALAVLLFQACAQYDRALHTCE